MISKENLQNIMEIITQFKAKHKGKNANTKYSFDELFVLGQELDQYLIQKHGIQKGGKSITYYNYASVSFIFSLIDETFGYTYNIIDYTGAAAEANKINDFNLVTGLAVEVNYTGNLLPQQTKRVPLAIMSSSFKTIQKAEAMNVDKTIGRALVKTLAFNTGFGAHIWFAENDFEEGVSNSFSVNQPLTTTPAISPSGFKANIDSVVISTPKQNNTPVVNQPVVAQPIVNQPVVNQPVVSQPTPQVVSQPQAQTQPLQNPFENNNKFLGTPQPIAQVKQVEQPIVSQPIAQVAIQPIPTPSVPVETKKKTTKKPASTMVETQPAVSLTKLIELINTNTEAFNYVAEFMKINNIGDISQIQEETIQTILGSLGGING